MRSSQKKPSAVREPVQVYLGAEDRSLLDQIANETNLSRAEVLRRGVRHLAAQLFAEASPMLAFMEEQRASDAHAPRDAAEHHDRHLTDRAPTVELPTKRSATKQRRRSGR